MSTVAIVVVVGFFLLMLSTQVLVQVRARAQIGKPVPALGGALGKHVERGRRALLYFHSPGCAACRSMTPKVQSLSQKSEGVFVVDISQDLATARALNVMATPSFIEIDDGKVLRFHVGAGPADLLSRYSS